MKRGFDNKKYLEIQSKSIFNKLNDHDRIYIEFGGHLTYDGHAKRVLPGYKPKNKLKLLKLLKNIEIIYCINAKNLNSKKRLGDFNLSYTQQTLKDLKILKRNKIKKIHVCITRYEKEIKALKFKKILENKKYKVFLHKEIPNYLKNINTALRGYENQPNIPVKEKIIIVTGVAGGSGKMATTLCQIYKDKKNKIDSEYVKFETFPVWNLPLNHPINIAYEAATADLQDKNMVDPYHLKKYNKKTINYNRGIENFKILKKINKKISYKNQSYNSPTEMGVNMVKYGIIDETVCKKAAIKEINRRMKKYYQEYKKGRESIKTIERMKEIIKKIK